MMIDDSVEQILNQYHPLVKHIAKSACYSSSAIDVNDLYQVGDMAVLRAIKAYDPSSGKNIKSFVAKSIRNAIFNEAAYFLGVLTVDFRTTAQASYVSKLYEKGMTDDDIAKLLTEKYGRDFDIDHVRDLRIVYSHKEYSQVQEDVPVDGIENDIAIKDLLESVIRDDLDRIILEKKILGKYSVEDLARETNMSRKLIYKREANLKNRIKRAIEDGNDL